MTTTTKTKKTTGTSAQLISGGFGIWRQPLSERPILIHRSLMPGYMRQLPKKRLVEGSGMMIVRVN